MAEATPASPGTMLYSDDGNADNTEQRRRRRSGQKQMSLDKNTRRFHLKSRGGCTNCKRRRIKCNERRPICSNCARRSEACEYQQVVQTARRESPDTSTRYESSTHIEFDTIDTTRSSEACTAPDVTTGAPTPGSTLGQGLSSVVDLTLGMPTADLELMHHYTRFTAKDLEQNGSGPSLFPIWQDFIPGLAFQHEFLLHGLLSISALHLSHLTPQRKAELTLQASVHQQTALASFQAALPFANEDNCPAFFAFSFLLIPITFVSSPRQSDREDGEADFFQWIKLIRGGYSLMQRYKDQLLRTELRPLLQPMLFRHVRNPHDIPDVHHIIPLFKLCMSMNDSEASDACMLATHDLLVTFGQASLQRDKGESSVIHSMLWPANLSMQFIDLLHARDPVAMIILAHYSVLLYRDSRSTTWYLIGFARYLLDAVQGALSDPWLEMLSWPESCIA